MSNEIKKGMIAMWGSHTDEVGIVTKVMKDCFYVRYTSFQSVPGPGGSRFKFLSRKILKSSVVDGKGWPPAGRVTVQPAQ